MGSGEEAYDATSATVEGPERARLWIMLKQIYPFFADHETKADRTIPVVVLTRG